MRTTLSNPELYGVITILQNKIVELTEKKENLAKRRRDQQEQAELLIKKQVCPHCYKLFLWFELQQIVSLGRIYPQEVCSSCAEIFYSKEGQFNDRFSGVYGGALGGVFHENVYISEASDDQKLETLWHYIQEHADPCSDNISMKRTELTKFMADIDYHAGVLYETLDYWEEGK